MVRTGTIAFLCGIVAAQQLAELPPVAWVISIPLLMTGFFALPGLRRFALPLCALAAGFSWACLYADNLLSKRLPGELEGREIELVGRILDIPVATERAARFAFQAEQLLDTGEVSTVDWKLRLNWYGKQRPQLGVGQQWQLRVKLKRPYGSVNPGGFDYEQWLFANGFSATGYVRQPSRAILRDGEVAAGSTMLRQALSDQIGKSLDGDPRQGIVRALAIGHRGSMSDSDWLVLTRTGTNHLVAISGLHIGLVAGFAWWLVIRLVSLSQRLCQLRPAQDYAAIAALSAAIIYAALAGFSVPTQRAMIMVCVFMMARLWRRHPSSLDTLCLALMLVLAYDPLSVLAPGFWLSFAAVAIIFASSSGQLFSASYLRQWGVIQLAISVGLVPLLVIMFGQFSLMSPIANFVAIPWVSFISVPLVFIAMLSSLVGLDFPWQLAALSIDGLFLVLDVISSLPFANLTVADPPGWVIMTALLGTTIMLLPRGIPGRWTGFLGILPLLVVQPPSPPSGELEVNVLDVGQGLAVVVRSQHHTLVYDTGPMFSSGDAGKTILLPYLASQGIRHIDKLVVSHSDTDHNGGTASLLSGLPVTSILAGQPAAVSPGAIQCRQGMHWNWDDVEFEILSPGDTEQLSDSDNNHSCVLKVSSRHGSLLLTGDIESPVEQRLVTDHLSGLASDILVVPHHGSQSSSSRAFIRAVRPGFVVYTVGYRNRYHLPSSKVTQRYAGIAAFRTDLDGMLTFHLGESGISATAWRRQNRRYWHGK